ncbi:hypothetical protein J2S74_002229 [Evansella vedderi]|uniref:Uncharacterized protein n=1 Tax=Evansella vedderi TaxID=38282 RepID=A0ABT9ZUC7_9BACI|nr:YkyB family protein [Evansella vedderi]MDQ0254850.1 hypothetical protein [Evansella vedderi]
MREKTVHPTNFDLREIQVALYTVNRHAKTAIDSSELYYLKKTVLKKLVHEKFAEKVSLEFSTNPRSGLQSSVVLVRVGAADSEQPFFFHTLAEKGDFKLEHRGKINHNLQNPRVHMGLETAKSILYKYLGEKPPRKRKHPNSKKKRLDNIFISSYLDGRKRY